MLLEKVLALHEWEMSNFPFFRTSTGRHIYVCLVRSSFSPENHEEVSIKKLLSSNFFTDRAIRMKIREMELKGYLESESGIRDQRVVTIRPSVYLKKMMQEHSSMLNQIVSKDILIIRKNTETGP